MAQSKPKYTESVSSVNPVLCWCSRLEVVVAETEAPLLDVTRTYTLEELAESLLARLAAVRFPRVSP